MIEQKKKNQYEAPEMTELEVRVEKGYAGSLGMSEGHDHNGHRTVEGRKSGGTWGGENATWT